MATELWEVIQKADELSEEDRLLLMEHLSRKIRTRPGTYRWTDLSGVAPNLLKGEDAQEWVSKHRRADTEHRDSCR